MKIKFSKIIIGFAAVGFLIGLVNDIVDVLYALGFGETHRALYEFMTTYWMLLCPFSIMTMGLEADETHWYASVAVLANILAFNTLLYGLIGAGVSKLWTHLKTPVPGTNPQ